MVAEASRFRLPASGFRLSIHARTAGQQPGRPLWRRGITTYEMAIFAILFTDLVSACHTAGGLCAWPAGARTQAAIDTTKVGTNAKRAARIANGPLKTWLRGQDLNL